MMSSRVSRMSIALRCQSRQDSQSQAASGYVNNVRGGRSAHRKISTWRRELGRLEARLAGGTAMPMWENSKLLREYGSSTLWDRLLGQLTAFVPVPLIGTLIPPTARNIGIKLNPQMPAPSRARRVQAQLNRSNWNLVSRILWTNRMRNVLGVLIEKPRGTVSYTTMNFS